MTNVEAVSRELERVYRAALGLTAVLEDVEPGLAFPEARWYLAQQLLRQLIDASDEARAKLVLMADAS